MYDLAEASSTTPAIVPASLRVTLAYGQDPAQVPTLAVAPVFLGVGEGGCLFVDLALAPSVITVTGRQRVRDELGAELVNRLGPAIREGARRFAVVVAGAPFDLDLLVPILVDDVVAADRPLFGR